MNIPKAKVFCLYLIDSHFFTQLVLNGGYWSLSVFFSCQKFITVSTTNTRFTSISQCLHQSKQVVTRIWSCWFCKNPLNGRRKWDNLSASLFYCLKFWKIIFGLTLLIQKFILLFRTSTDVPRAVARFLDVHLTPHRDMQVQPQHFAKNLSKHTQRTIKDVYTLPLLILKLHNNGSMKRGACELHCSIFEFQLQLKWNSNKDIVKYSSIAESNGTRLVYQQPSMHIGWKIMK